MTVSEHRFRCEPYDIDVFIGCHDACMSYADLIVDHSESDLVQALEVAARTSTDNQGHASLLKSLIRQRLLAVDHSMNTHQDPMHGAKQQQSVMDEQDRFHTCRVRVSSLTILHCRRWLSLIQAITWI